MLIDPQMSCSDDRSLNSNQKMELQRYINRLGVAKKKAEKKITDLGGEFAKAQTMAWWQDPNKESDFKGLLTSERLIHSSTGLFHFMEFMERNSAMKYVQFLLMADSFKKLAADPKPDKYQELREDAKNIFQLYLNRTSPQAVPVSDALVEEIEDYVSDDPKRPDNYGCVIRAHDQVVEYVNHEYVKKFVDSDLYYRLAVDPAFIKEMADQTSAIPAPPAAAGAVSIISPTATLPTSQAPTPALPAASSSSSSSSPPFSTSLTSTLPLAATSPQDPPSTRSLSELDLGTSESPSTPPASFHSGGKSPTYGGDLGDEKEPRMVKKDSRSDLHLDVEGGEPSSSEALRSLVSDDEEDMLRQSDTVSTVEAAFQDVIHSAEAQAAAAAAAVTQDRPKMDIYVYDGSHEKMVPDVDDVDLAPPGDLLGRKTTLNEITEAIDNITHKESILDTLIKKALKKKGSEKNNELRILQMSKSKYQRELQELMFRKGKLENQESKDVLTPGLCNIQISTSTIGYENGKPFAMYVIEVHRNDPLNPSGWVVARRYREFFDLHNKLRVKFPLVNDFDLPGKKMMNLFKLNSKFVEERRVNLQSYLQLLLDNKDVCRCDELREFLCQREQRFAGSSAKGEGEFGDITQEPPEPDKGILPKYVKQMSDLSREALSGVVRPFSDVIGDLISSASTVERIGSDLENIQKTAAETQAQAEAATGGKPGSEEAQSPYETKSEDGEEPAYKPEGFTSLSEPLCNLIIELFEMKERSSFLRRQAVLVILQQILGGTIERKVSENIEWNVNEENIVYYLDKFQQTWWPDGKMAESWPVRNPAQREATKGEARQKLVTVLPMFFSSMIGSENSRRGGVRLFDGEDPGSLHHIFIPPY